MALKRRRQLQCFKMVIITKQCLFPFFLQYTTHAYFNNTVDVFMWMNVSVGTNTYDRREACTHIYLLFTLNVSRAILQLSFYLFLCNFLFGDVRRQRATTKFAPLLPFTNIGILIILQKRPLRLFKNI